MAKVRAFGIALQLGDGDATETFTTIAQLLTVTGPSQTAETLDVTTHDSAGDYREVVATFLNGGTVPFTFMYDPALGTHDGTTGIASFFDAATHNFQLVLPDAGATVISFAGFLTGFTPVSAGGVSDRLEGSGEITVSGAVTIT